MVTDDDTRSLALRCVAAHAPAGADSGAFMLRRRLRRHADRCAAMLDELDLVTIYKHDDSVLYELGRPFYNLDLYREAASVFQRTSIS
jgi:hypothetical protein